MLNSTVLTPVVLVNVIVFPFTFTAIFPRITGLLFSSTVLTVICIVLFAIVLFVVIVVFVLTLFSLSVAFIRAGLYLFVPPYTTFIV